ncbi:vesicle-associated membrane protein 7 [Pseudohyphozyma bogoriensis]|nr:vesicle-associated membrane protein 7 [Pseudohyphozyma bogoriensis]
MSLLHALVARDTVVLSEKDLSPNGQQYAQATQTILSKIPPNDSKLTYAADTILIHYAKVNGLVAMVVAEDAAGRRMPFAFLTELLRNFNATFSPHEISDAPSYGMASFSEEIGRMMQTFTDNPPNDPIKTAQQELDQTKNIMVQNLESLLVYFLLASFCGLGVNHCTS